MRKKITSLCMALCLTFMLINPGQAQAQENSITPNTVINKDNISEVLKYVNLDPSSFNETDVTGESIYTVGELQKFIEKAMKQPQKIEDNTTASAPSGGLISLAAATASRGSVALKHTYVGGGNSFTLTYQVSGTYAYHDWVTAGAASIGIGTDLASPVYKASFKSTPYITWTSRVVTMQATAVVDTYVGVGGIGLLKVASQEINTTRNWDRSYNPYVAPAYPGYALTYGSTGSNVRLIQERLNYLGFNCGTVDGSFGPATKTAVINFQSKRGLATDASVGPATWGALFSM